MQGCDLCGVTSGHVHHTTSHSQVPKRCRLYSSLSFRLLSYGGHLQ